MMYVLCLFLFLCHKRIRRFTWYVVHPVSLPLSGVAAAVPPLGMQAARTKTNEKPKKTSYFNEDKFRQCSCPLLYNINNICLKKFSIATIARYRGED